MTYRYYVGFQLPKGLRENIEKVQNELFDPALMREPLEPHITILPPPAVEQLDPHNLAERVRETAKPFLPLKLMFENVEAFTDTAISIHVESEQIFSLQEKLATLLPDHVTATYFPNPQFTPHITLAQAERGRHLSPELLANYQERCLDFLPATGEVAYLTLFISLGQRQYQTYPIV